MITALAPSATANAGIATQYMLRASERRLTLLDVACPSHGGPPSKMSTRPAERRIGPSSGLGSSTNLALPFRNE